MVIVSAVSAVAACGAVIAAGVAVFYAIKAANLCVHAETLIAAYFGPDLDDVADPDAPDHDGPSMLITGVSGTVYRVSVGPEGHLVSEPVN